MALRLRFTPAVLLLLLPALLLCGCKPRHNSQPVILHVLRNLHSPYGSEMDRRILDFQGSNPHAISGQPILIESSTGDFKDLLQKQTGSSDNYDLIILDSPEDAGSNLELQKDLPRAVNVCAGLKACPANIPAIIPSQITGEHLEAAKMFQDALQKAP